MVHSDVHRANGGTYAILPPNDLERGMAASLRWALWHPPVSPAPAPATLPAATAGKHVDAPNDHVARVS